MAETVSITICGDGGCGTLRNVVDCFFFQNEMSTAIATWTRFASVLSGPCFVASELYPARPAGSKKVTKSECFESVGKSSITLRLVRSQWIHELVSCRLTSVDLLEFVY